MIPFSVTDNKYIDEKDRLEAAGGLFFGGQNLFQELHQVLRIA